MHSFKFIVYSDVQSQQTVSSYALKYYTSHVIKLTLEMDNQEKFKFYSGHVINPQKKKDEKLSVLEFGRY
jgi:hypothetical protein